MPSLHWIGKDKVVSHHLDVPYRVLDRKYSFGEAEAASANKILHGDNLEALKALLPEYEGRIDCVYIDPPYNIVGRVLRRPHAHLFESKFLNLAYVFTSSARFNATLDTVVKGLNRAGFGDDDYRVEESQKVVAPKDGAMGAAPAVAPSLLDELEKVEYRAQAEGHDYAAGVVRVGEAKAPAYEAPPESPFVAAVSSLVESSGANTEAASPARELRETVFAPVGSLKSYPIKEEFRAAPYRSSCVGETGRH